MNATAAVATAKFRFPKSASVSDAEGQIRQARDLGDAADIEALVPSRFDRDLMADIWSAVALGTLFRKSQHASTIAWGLGRPEDFAARKFALTPPGLVATVLGEQVRCEGSSNPEDMRPTLDWIKSDVGGYVANVDKTRGAERWVIEFDNARALSLRHGAKHGASIDRRVFEQLLRRVRQDLEIWWARDNRVFDATAHSRFVVPSADQVEHRDAVDELATFVWELFENAYEHGRVFSVANRHAPNLRFIRFRKIVDYSADGLFKRAGDSEPILREFVQSVVDRGRETALLEICVSDFGLGVLDRFLSTPAGEKYSNEPRAKVLDELLYGDLTSKATDPSAGHGILYALEAAQRAGAFVSLRTNEFWRARSYGPASGDVRLQDVGGSDTGHVAGTHWQMIWAPSPR